MLQNSYNKRKEQEEVKTERKDIGEQESRKHK